MKTSKTLRDEQIMEKYRKAYPHFSEEQLLEARRNMIKYVQILRRIAIRERMEREASAQSSKTDKDAQPKRAC